MFMKAEPNVDGEVASKGRRTKKHWREKRLRLQCLLTLDRLLVLRSRSEGMLPMQAAIMKDIDMLTVI